MIMPNYLPALSAYSPVGASEGSMDPLGLQNAAGRLADLLLPGLTVRVERARCITLAVLAVELANDTALASADENRQDAILAFERLCLSALVRQVDRTTDRRVRGFPGRQKAHRAQQQKQPLTLSSYVKGPATNGLVGIHFRTARTGYLFDDNYRVLARGERLLQAWQHGIDKSAWSDLRRKVISQVHREVQDKAGLPLSWPGYEDLASLCRLDKMRTTERQVLAEALNEPDAGLQSTTLSRLRMADCQAAYRAPAASPDDGDAADSTSRGDVERAIMTCLAHRPAASLPQSAALQAVAETALAYEEVSGYLTLVFDTLRSCGHAHRSFRVADVLGNAAARRNLDACVAGLATAVPALREKLQRVCTLAVPQARLNRGAEDLSQLLGPFIDELDSGQTPGQLVEWALRRHQQVQAAKHKQPWLVQDGAGPYRFFPEYALAGPPQRVKALLHAYRLLNAYSLLSDLKLLA